MRATAPQPPHEYQLIVTKLDTNYPIAQVLSKVKSDYIRICLKDLSFGLAPTSSGFGSAILAIPGLVSNYQAGDYLNVLRGVTFVADSGVDLAVNSNLLGASRHTDLIVHRSQLEQLGYLMSLHIDLTGITGTIESVYISLMFYEADTPSIMSGMKGEPQLH